MKMSEEERVLFPTNENPDVGYLESLLDEASNQNLNPKDKIRVNYYPGKKPSYEKVGVLITLYYNCTGENFTPTNRKPNLHLVE